MNVTKRNGVQEEMKFDKVTKRIAQKCVGLSDSIDSQKLAMSVIEGLFDGVSTSQIDTQIAETAASKVVEHPDYSQLAANVSISNLHKNTKTTFSTVMKDLYDYVNPKNNKHSPVVSEDLINVIKKNSSKINSYIDYNRDYNYDYFGYRTLEKSYLLKINGVVAERPQHMLMRVSLGIHGEDLDNAFKTYDMMSNKMFTHATPTLFNSGTPRPQMSSCFLIDMIDDSIEGIYDTLKIAAKISKDAGGIGLTTHKVRSTGSYIAGTNGTSNGIVPMLKVFNETARYVDQCFAGDTNIMTEHGIKKISDINRGDKVLTDDGMFNTVKETRIYEKDSQEILEISTIGLPTKVTDIHPLMGIKLGDNSTPKRELGRLLSGLNKENYYEAKDFNKGDYLGRVIPKVDKDIEYLSVDDLRFYGILLGDSIITETRKECNIYLGTTEKSKTIDFVESYLNTNFIKYTKYVIESITKFYIHLPTNPKFKFNRNDLYNSFSEKRINTNYLNLPKNKSLALLKGLVETDGSIKDDRIMFYNTSKELIDGVDYLVLRLHLPLYITKRNRIGEISSYKNIETKKISYECEIPKSEEMCEVFGVSRPKFLKHLVYNGIVFTKITDISYQEIGQKVTTYDLCVENNHTYTTQLSTNTNGGGKRKGSFAVYIEPWHSDVLEFLDLKKNHGKEEQRARDLFYAMWINDLFMERVESDGIWSLMSPSESKGLDEVYGDDFKKLYERYESEGKFIGQIKARSLWEKITTSQIETGTPYMLYKDSANSKSNQKNLGTIKSSNLCVSGHTNILTTNGYKPIKDLENTFVDVWNGEVYSNVEVKKTGEYQKLLDISFTNGSEISCTEYHKFYVQEGYVRGVGKNKLKQYVKRANELVVGDKIQKFETPLIDFSNKTMKNPYTQGFFSGDGCSFNDKNHIDLYGEKLKLLEYLSTKNIGNISKNINGVDKQRVSVDDSYIKFEVPLKHNIHSRVKWLEGILDSDGCLLDNKGTQSIQLCSIHKDFLINIMYMLQTLGVSSKVLDAREEGYRNLPDGKGGCVDYLCKRLYRLSIPQGSLNTLKILGFSPKRITLNENTPNRSAERFIKVSNISFNNKYEDTFCVTEPKRGRVIFNGIETGNCAEIIEFTSPKEVAVCNLASIALPSFVKIGDDGVPYFDHNELYKVAYQATFNLNRVIDRNYYPVEEARVSNMKHRPIGLGIQGLADLFMLMRLPFTSTQAKLLNKDVHETIYFASMTCSNDIAKTDGHYETFKGSPLSKGIFQFEMWGLNDSDLSGRWDWSTLRKSVVKHGVINSLLTALMPTASTGQILGNNECFEPITSNMGTRRVLSGEFITINKHLIKDLISLDLWDNDMKEFLMAKNGSVQDLPIPEDLKELYKTAYELSMKDIIDMSADRGAFVDQSQSLNLFMKDATSKKLRSMHFYSWKKGLKTGMYYLRTKAATNAKKFTLDVDVDNRLSIANEEYKKAEEIKSDDAMSAEDFRAMVERSRNASQSDDDVDCLMCGS